MKKEEWQMEAANERAEANRETPLGEQIDGGNDEFCEYNDPDATDCAKITTPGKKMNWPRTMKGLTILSKEKATDALVTNLTEKN